MLERRRLVQHDTSGRVPFLTIHRTVQWNVLLHLSREPAKRWKVVQDTLDLLQSKLPDVSPTDNPEPELWDDFAKYVPQVVSVRAHCLWPDPPVELPVEFAHILSDMATFMWHAGLMSQGYAALKTAEQILDDRRTPSQDSLRGNIHEHIGIIASFYGVSQREECMRRRHKAIEARKAWFDTIPKDKVTREDEIRLWNPQSDLAFGLMQEENFEEAEAQIEKCHKQYQEWDGPEKIPFEYLKYNHIISYVRMFQNRSDEAIATCERAVELGKECAGDDHPMTQLVRFSLVNHLYLTGELKKALDLSLSVLEARSNVCGEYNPFTLESHVMCGFLLLKSNQADDAE